MRLESRARATRKIFGIASRAREWGAKGRAIVSWVRRVEVIVGNVDILRDREQRRRHGEWAGWDGSIVLQFNGTWPRKLTPWPNHPSMIPTIPPGGPHH